MGRKLTQKELIKHKDNALKLLDTYLTSLINHSDEKVNAKSDKLSYWLEDWAKFLNFENNFTPSSLRRYKRGEIIKAHLGYNIGSEEGGLHYCVIIDKANSIHSPVVTIVPLTSVKEKNNLSKLHRGEIYLGNELFINLNSKINAVHKSLQDKICDLKAFIKTSPSKHQEFLDKLQLCEEEKKLLELMYKEVQKMRIGSIALTNQLRTISKIRIYDPKTNHDILSNIKLSNEKLDLIDKAIIQQFIGKIQS